MQRALLITWPPCLLQRALVGMTGRCAMCFMLCVRARCPLQELPMAPKEECSVDLTKTDLELFEVRG